MNKEARDFVDRGLALFPDNLILKNELCYILETEGDVSPGRSSYVMMYITANPLEMMEFNSLSSRSTTTSGRSSP